MSIKSCFYIVLTIIILFIGYKTVCIEKIEGNEAVVRQSLTEGVLNDVWLSGTKFYCGWILDTYKYDIGTQKITFDNQEKNISFRDPRQ